MKWHQTKIGKIQIGGLLFGSVLSLVLKNITGEPLQRIDYLIAEVVGGNAFFIFFIPSVIVPLFSKSEKVRLISVYFMIVLLILSFCGNYYSYLLYSN
jgi:hypothetical protein